MGDLKVAYGEQELAVDVPDDGSEVHVVTLTIEGETVVGVDVDGMIVKSAIAPEYPAE